MKTKTKMVKLSDLKVPADAKVNQHLSELMRKAGELLIRVHACRDDGFSKLFVPQSKQWIDLQDFSGWDIAGSNCEN